MGDVKKKKKKTQTKNTKEPKTNKGVTVEERGPNKKVHKSKCDTNQFKN